MTSNLRSNEARITNVLLGKKLLAVALAFGLGFHLIAGFLTYRVIYLCHFSCESDKFSLFLFKSIGVPAGIVVDGIFIALIGILFFFVLRLLAKSFPETKLAVAIVLIMVYVVIILINFVDAYGDFVLLSHYGLL